jgi:6-pyruvoyltetrahydropterin/6-carboxytetrahydropterin synthase
MKVRREYRFEASHVLPRHRGMCSRLHGHSYRFLLEVEGPIDPGTGMVVDFFEIDRVVEQRILATLDHRHLNDLLENPTAEWIAVFIWRQLEGDLPGMTQIELFETEGASCVYRGERAEGA